MADSAFGAARPWREAGRTSGGQADGEDAQRPEDAASQRRGPAPAMDRRRATPSERAAATERSRPWPEDTRSHPPRQAGAERSDDTQFDADYRQWREEQMRLLDLDYAQWRKERYRKFAEEFSQWRSQRLNNPPGSPRTSPEDTAHSLGDISPLPGPGPTPRREERERSGGGLLNSLLGHGERHKPQA